MDFVDCIDSHVHLAPVDQRQNVLDTIVISHRPLSMPKIDPTALGVTRD
jgi:hypothetical protein